MAWNEPGGQQKDPWNRKSDPEQGPPDLDEAIRKLQNSLRGMFGAKNKPSSEQPGSDTPRKPPVGFPISFTAIAVIAFVIWGLSGIYIVEPDERAVVTRFGQYKSVEMPGPHWAPRFIDKREIVNVEQVSSYSYATQMLTRDENIVAIEVDAQYRVADAPASLFNVVDPHDSLEHALQSALRQVIGGTSLDDALTTGRQKVRDEVMTILTNIMDTYQTGIVIADVNLQAVRPPQEVQGAFDDVIKAREDQERLRNEAETYANGIVPIAEGHASRIVEAAGAYRDQIVLKARGEIEIYERLLPVYKKSPEVTRERLYLETLEQVLANNKTVLVDVEGGNNLMYLPLDKLMAAGAPPSTPSTSAQSPMPRPLNQSPEVPLRSQPATPTAPRSTTRTTNGGGR